LKKKKEEKRKKTQLNESLFLTKKKIEWQMGY